MKLETCKNGHLWDPSLTSTCPECAFLEELRQREDKETVQLEAEDYILPERPNLDRVERVYFRNADGSMGEIHVQENLVFNHGFPRLITCPNGHRYDPELTPECPECAMMEGFQLDLEELILDDREFANGDIGLENIDVSGNCDAEGDTIQLAITECTAGWLVCLEGRERGKSFPLYCMSNYIGHSRKNAVCLENDLSVAALEDCVIVYDDEDAKFYFSVTENALRLRRLNGRPVLSTVELKQGDVLTIGNSNFLFVPLCGEAFRWED